MDKHKQVRNWRGYFKEYTVIVIGVLTARGAQQAAEWWQWREKTAYATEGLTVGEY